MEATARAIAWAQHTPRAEVIARFESIVGKRGRNEDPSLLKYWRSPGLAKEGGVISKTDFQLWVNWLVRDGEAQARSRRRWK